jgi:hypothetical protein
MNRKIMFIDERNIKILDLYNQNFFNQAVNFFLKDFNKKKELEMCLVLKTNISFKPKKIYVEKATLNKLKEIAIKNKITLVQLYNYAIQQYHIFLNQ